jgi:hypothetical protein
MKVQEPAREAFLYQIWLEKRFGQEKLCTIDGKELEIREKGVRNFDAGPDFLNALIYFDGNLIRGDVEIHPIAGDWYTHGHHLDARYNNVILHVVTMDCPKQFHTINQNKCLVATLNMDSFLARPAEEMDCGQDYAVEDFHIRSCGLAAQNVSVKKHVVDSAGVTRFEIKTAQFLERRQTESWEQIFYQSLLVSFGYSKNQIPFGLLGQKLPVEVIWSYIWNDPAEIAVQKAEAFLFGAAGLLPCQAIRRRKIIDPVALKYVALLEGKWISFPERNRIAAMKAEEWQFFRLRPQNFPTRRISAAAAIVKKFMDNGFVETLYNTLLACEGKPEKSFREIEALFRVKSNSFWASHFTFDSPAHSEPDKAAKENLIIGAERSRDIALNLVLPILNAFGIESADGHLCALICEIFNRYPVCAENQITREMRHRLDLEDKAFAGAKSQQGMMHLYKNVCKKENCDHCLIKTHE